MAKPSAEVRAQIEKEIAGRNRLAVPAFAGGVLYLLSAIIVSGTLKAAPTVGLLQGLEPAINGIKAPVVSPRAEEVKFISHHAFALISSSVMAAIAIVVLILVLLLLLDATLFRRPQVWRWTRSLVLWGGIIFAAVSVGHQVVTAIATHNFATGKDLSNEAVENALTRGGANIAVQYLDLLSGLALAAGMGITCLNAQRVGLLPRWMGMVGIFSAVLLFFPIGGAELQLVPAFWMVMVGVLYIGRWPNEPQAWVQGVAVPWPTAAERAAERAAAKGEAPPKRGGRPKAAVAAAAPDADAAPEPAKPSGASSRKRRRKRGGRG